MPNPLLSSYRSGENRVTSSTMAVLERLDLTLVQELLESATGAGGELTTVLFENQVTGKGSVPDARISARFTWLFETKTDRGAYASEGSNRNQIRHHSQLIDGDPSAILFVITPDTARPTWFDELDDVAESTHGRILWMCFRDLADAATSIIMDPARLVSEQTKFLLNELVALYESDGLLTTYDTVVVAARVAWPEYLDTSSYVCQPMRSFRDGLIHFGFYADGSIKRLLPRIRVHYSSVPFTPEEASKRIGMGDIELADLISRNLEWGTRVEGQAYDVFLLTAPNDLENTEVLQADIANDMTSSSGRGSAWTQGQRYTRLERLKLAKFTSQL
jgi:hypothetical protein